MILHFAKENDFKVSQTCLPRKCRVETTLGAADCLTLASASFCLKQGLTLWSRFVERHSVAQAAFRLTAILLPPSARYWDCRCELPLMVHCLHFTALKQGLPCGRRPRDSEALPPWQRVKAVAMQS